MKDMNHSTLMAAYKGRKTPLCLLTGRGTMRASAGFEIFSCRNMYKSLEMDDLSIQPFLQAIKWMEHSESDCPFQNISHNISVSSAQKECIKLFKSVCTPPWARSASHNILLYYPALCPLFSMSYTEPELSLIKETHTHCSFYQSLVLAFDLHLQCEYETCISGFFKYICA